MNLELALVH